MGLGGGRGRRGGVVPVPRSVLHTGYPLGVALAAVLACFCHSLHGGDDATFAPPFNLVSVPVGLEWAGPWA